MTSKRDSRCLCWLWRQTRPRRRLPYRFVSKFTVASCGSPFDSTGFLFRKGGQFRPWWQRSVAVLWQQSIRGCTRSEMKSQRGRLFKLIYDDIHCDIQGSTHHYCSAWLDSAFCPRWDGKMNINFRPRSNKTAAVFVNTSCHSIFMSMTSSIQADWRPTLFSIHQWTQWILAVVLWTTPVIAVIIA